MSPARSGTFIGPSGYYQQDLMTVHPVDNVFQPGVTAATPPPAPTPTPAPTPAPPPGATNSFPPIGSFPPIVKQGWDAIQSAFSAYQAQFLTELSNIIKRVSR